MRESCWHCADDVLYLKTDENNRVRSNDRNLPAFQYNNNGKCYSMSYHKGPGGGQGDPDDMTLWANGAARRSAANKKPKK